MSNTNTNFALIGAAAARFACAFAACLLVSGCDRGPAPAPPGQTLATSEAPSKAPGEPVAAAVAARPAESNPPADSAPTEHELTGKPGWPIRVRSTLDGALAPVKPQAVTVSVQPTRPVDALSVRIRGLDGVAVAGPLTGSFGRTSVQEVRRQTFRTAVRASVAGYVAVDVSWKVGGVTQSGTWTFRAQATGATYKTPRQGRLVADENGRPVHAMPAQVR